MHPEYTAGGEPQLACKRGATFFFPRLFSAANTQTHTTRRCHTSGLPAFLRSSFLAGVPMTCSACTTSQEMQISVAVLANEDAKPLSCEKRASTSSVYSTEQGTSPSSVRHIRRKSYARGCPCSVRTSTASTIVSCSPCSIAVCSRALETANTTAISVGYHPNIQQRHSFL